MPPYIKGLQGGRLNLFEQPVNMSFSDPVNPKSVFIVFLRTLNSGFRPIGSASEWKLLI